MGDLRGIKRSHSAVDVVKSETIYAAFTGELAEEQFPEATRRMLQGLVRSCLESPKAEWDTYLERGAALLGHALAELEASLAARGAASTEALAAFRAGPLAAYEELAGSASKREEAQLSDAELLERSLCHLATRPPVGTTATVGALLGRKGLRSWRFRSGKQEETFTLGAACSEVFTNQRLAKVLSPALERMTQSVHHCAMGWQYQPLSIHTSAGLPAPIGTFLQALSKHFPWPDSNTDWFVNLQLEGCTAVWAAVEALVRVRDAEGVARPLVAVAPKSYHGPKTTGLGAPVQARWPGAPPTDGQLTYPMPPSPYSSKADQDAYIEEFDAFVKSAGNQIGVILFEPQWGSSCAARPWPKRCLQEAVRIAKAAGIKVVCDEIMCGLGRHGQGTLFLSQAWNLEPDAVTFGKSMSAGPFPLAGCIVKQGAGLLCEHGVKLTQSHTYAGSSALAMITAACVLEEVPKWFAHAERMGGVVAEILGPLEDESVQVNGLGLMWGVLFVDTDPQRNQEALGLLRAACAEAGVWPYFVPAGGAMLSPPMDTSEEDLREALTRLARCVRNVREQLKSSPVTPVAE